MQDITANVFEQQRIVKQGRFICEFCGVHFYHATALVTHCEKEHGKALRKYCIHMHKCYCMNACVVMVGIEQKSFSNWIAFISWKEEEQKLTYSYFVKPNGEVVNNNGKWH